MKIDEDKYEGVLVCGHKATSPDKPDNLYGNCEGCGCEIVFRPHSPHGPEICKLCFECGLEAMGEMVAAGEIPEILITDKTKEEVAAFFGRTIQ